MYKFTIAAFFFLSLCSFSSYAEDKSGKKEISAELSDTEILERVKNRYPLAYKKFMKQQTDEPDKFARNMDIIRNNMKKRQGKRVRSSEKNSSRGDKEKIKSKLFKLAGKYRNAEEKDKEGIRAEITAKVTEAFDSTTEEREGIISDTEKKLASAQEKMQKARKMLDRRKENRTQHINAFIEKLLDK
ncbi:MAG: hypothetical protein ACYTFY_00485 [Planctomycetota bacterium]|jgi:hypothetical protein